MKILYDLLTLHSKNGAAEYTRKIFFSLLSKIRKTGGDTILYCLYDSTSLPQYEDMLPEVLNGKNVKFVDVNDGIDKLNELGCDVFFFSCAQHGGGHPDLQEINCKSIIVFHDCAWEELYNNDILIYMTLNSEDIFRYREKKPRGKKIYFEIKSPTIRFCRWLLNVRQHGVMERGYKMLQPALNLLKRRDDNMVITVSEYSKRALMYNFDIPETKIHVEYSPERIFVGGAEFSENERLRSLITEGKKYYLLVSADRVAKNAKKALAAFQKYVKIFPNSYIVTIGYKRELYENHIDLPILSDCDLLQAYVNCYALVYPSYFEGFGYPPVEAMKCGKPVLSSNVCSMPEVLGDAPIYFSPIYESAIFGAFCQLTDDNYQYYSEKSKMQYLKVCEKQEQDLEELVNIILS